MRKLQRGGGNGLGGGETSALYLGCDDATGEVGRDHFEMAQVPGVDLFGIDLPGRGEIKCVVDHPARMAEPARAPEHFDVFLGRKSDRSEPLEERFESEDCVAGAQP